VKDEREEQERREREEQERREAQECERRLQEKEAKANKSRLTPTGMNFFEQQFSFEALLEEEALAGFTTPSAPTTSSSLDTLPLLVPTSPATQTSNSAKRDRSGSALGSSTTKHKNTDDLFDFLTSGTTTNATTATTTAPSGASSSTAPTTSSNKKPSSGTIESFFW